MIEKIVDILRVFLEKHFLPSLLSVVTTAVAYYFIPDNFDMVNKLGKKFFVFALFCLSLLIIEMLILLYNKMSAHNFCSKQEKEHQKREESKIEETLFEISSSLSSESRKLLEYFLENKNEPIILEGYIYGDRLLEDYCDSIEFKVDNDNTFALNPFNLNEKVALEKGRYVTKYRLKDYFFENFSYLKKKYGKITKF